MSSHIGPRRSEARGRQTAKLSSLTAISGKNFLNRELSWLAFNRRVLAEACDDTVPLAERLKFQGIVCSNLDEFFMVRVAGLKALVAEGVVQAGADGLSPKEQLAKISDNVHEMLEKLYSNWREAVEPGLATLAGITIVSPKDLTQGQLSALRERFAREVWPVLTPLAVDPGHPFPMLRNRSLNLAVLLRKVHQQMPRRPTIFAVVEVPTTEARLIQVPASSTHGPSFLLFEDLIRMHVEGLFPGFQVVGCSPFRVTRNSELTIDPDETDDLLKTILRQLKQRERGQPVRLEIAHDAPPAVRRFLLNALHLEAEDVYSIRGPLHLADLVPLYRRDDLGALKDPPFAPQHVPELAHADIFQAIARHDLLIQHPYESFDHVVDFVSQAADDPNVLAIKQTLYRTSPDSPIVRALIRAAENGKQVTAMVELRARFDEAPNIAWARALEQVGVHVVYGVGGLKTHCKVALVVRREQGKIRRYVHLSTGNYNPETALVYSDLSYFTCREAFADDAGALFNLLTGYSTPPSWQRFAVAPVGLSERLIELIERERSQGSQGRIIAKMNSLVDTKVIRALYRASRAGVQIDLLIRGICCLRPGVLGKSENIRVTSVVDRFLEHSRIFVFGARGQVFLSSADWMPRNFVERIEVMFPIEDDALRSRILDEILAISLADNCKAWRLLPDGTYQRCRHGTDRKPLRRSQSEFIELARNRRDVQPDPVDEGGGLPARDGFRRISTSAPLAVTH